MPKVPYSLINKALQGRERRFAAGFQANYNEERGFILTNHNFIIYSTHYACSLSAAARRRPDPDHQDAGLGRDPVAVVFNTTETETLAGE